MINNFFVLDGKKCLSGLLIVSLLTIACILGNDLVGGVIETASKNRLLPIYSVETNENKVALTFDVAWGADDIPSIIDTLEENEVEATFFIVGTWIDKYPDKLKLLSDSKMEIANHSYNHAHINKMSYGELLEDITKCNEKIKDIAGNDVKFYRGPYGEYNNTLIEVAREMNMQVIQWDVDTLDYEGKTCDEMCARIKKKIKNGSIILMHNDTKYTATSLSKIINNIKELGYEIVPLEELIYHENYEINHEGRQTKI